MSQYFPVNYQELYGSGRSRDSERKKTGMERDVPEFYAANINIKTLDQYFDVLSRICGKPFDISSLTKLRAFLVQVQEELMLRAGMPPNTTFYSFIRANRPSSLQFRIQCKYDTRRYMDEVSKLCANEQERRQIIKVYRFTGELRTDVLLVNVLYHLMQFMEEFSDRDCNLLELVKCYFRREERICLSNALSSKGSCAADCQPIHVPGVEIRSGTFPYIYNSITKPATPCKSASDVAQHIQIITTLMRCAFSNGNLKTFVVARGIPPCNCQFDFHNFVVSRSTEQIWKAAVGEALQSDDYRNVNAAYYRMMKEVVGYLCSLRGWLRTRLQNAPNSAETDSLENLLAQITEYGQANDKADQNHLELSELQMSGSEARTDCGEIAPLIEHSDDVDELKQMCRSLLRKVDLLQSQYSVVCDRLDSLERRFRSSVI